jgi:serine/threonine protein phosphatase PrpC
MSRWARKVIGYPFLTMGWGLPARKAKGRAFPYNNRGPNGFRSRPETGWLASAMAVDCSNTKPGVEMASLTDVGRQRSNNEDSYLYWEPDSDEEFRRKGRLAVIADGMGGYEGGQEASRLAVETVRHVYDSAVDSDPQLTLIEGLAAAHQNIQRYADEHPQFHGMGTTCTALSIVGRELFFAHVGDSRLYLVRPQTVSRLTRDHSYVGRLVESGIVRSEDAESHPQRHILTAALGSGKDLVADRPDHPLPLEEGDALVLCTDGLWSLVGEQDIAAVVRSNTPADSCLALVRMALERGGPDNVTVLVLRIAA